MENLVSFASYHRGRIVAKQPSSRHVWRLYYFHDGKFTPISHLGRAGHRYDFFGTDFASIEEAAHSFGFHLRDSDLYWPICNDYENEGDNIDFPLVREAVRKRQWYDAEQTENERAYWASCQGTCAQTRDARFVVVRDAQGERLARVIDAPAAKDILGHRIAYDKLPDTENKAFAPLDEDDCFIEMNGAWVPLKTLKQIKAVCRELDFAEAA